jgi:tetratricopeptide (TPR) repeat protein
MLGDLKDKLEPIGKLDALDGVGSRVLSYYSRQDASELSDAALLQRSRALSLMGEVATNRGDLNTAYSLYREAAAGTGEAIQRNPDDPQRLYDHAQNQFYLGEIAIKRGELANAETAFREYKRLADRMVALDSDNMKFRMEVQNANANLASVLGAQRRFQEAAAQWSQAFRMIEAITTADPTNRDYQQSLVESLAWYADAEKDAGNLKLATDLRQRNIALLSRLALQTSDVNWKQKLVPAERGLGSLYLAQGQLDQAVTHMRVAVVTGDGLMRVEPGNGKWSGNAARARIYLSESLLLNGNLPEAVSTNEAACAAFTNLLRKDGTVQDWRAGLRDCWLLRAQIAAAQGKSDVASNAAKEAIAMGKTVKSADQTLDQYNLAKAYRVLGDIRRGSGDMAGATAAWKTGLSLIPRVSAERPIEAHEHAELLDRTGQPAQSQRQWLARMGFHYPLLPFGDRRAR